MRVEVAYRGPEGEALVAVELGRDASVADAIDASGVVERLGLFEAALAYAIFGERAEASTRVEDGDRIELVRPLVADPKDARRRRAAEKPLTRALPSRKRRRSAP